MQGQRNRGLRHQAWTSHYVCSSQETGKDAAPGQRQEGRVEGALQRKRRLDEVDDLCQQVSLTGFRYAAACLCRTAGCLLPDLLRPLLARENNPVLLQHRPAGMLASQPAESACHMAPTCTRSCSTHDVLSRDHVDGAEINLQHNDLLPNIADVLPRKLMRRACESCIVYVVSRCAAGCGKPK